MQVSSQLVTLAQWMAGEFTNKVQAIAEPVWYVHLHLWQRPLPISVFGDLALFAEQANSLYLDKSYRQRIMRFVETEEGIAVNYFGFRHPEAFIGAGANPELLAKITLDDLEPLPGCSLKVSVSPNEPKVFTATLPTDAHCCFQYNGETRQVILGFEATASEFKSFDHGINPETKAAIWGAIAGPYCFTKIQDFSPEVSLLTTENY